MVFTAWEKKEIAFSLGINGIRPDLWQAVGKDVRK
jgi:hypothetical protein